MRWWVDGYQIREWLSVFWLLSSEIATSLRHSGLTILLSGQHMNKLAWSVPPCWVLGLLLRPRVPRSDANKLWLRRILDFTSQDISAFEYQLIIYYPLTSRIIPVTSSRWPLQKLRQRRSPLYDHPNGLYSLQNHMCHGHNMLDVVSSSDHHEGFRLMVISTYMYACIYIYIVYHVYIYIFYII